MGTSFGPIQPAEDVLILGAGSGGIGGETAQADQAEQEGAGDGDGGEHRDGDADAEREGEAANRPGSKGVEDAAGHHRTEVGVEDGGEGAFEVYLKT